MRSIESRCIIYIVRRTQLYLDDDLWSVLHTLARKRGGTISDLVRIALREKYGQERTIRKEAFEGIIGLWKNRKDLSDTDEYVRSLRHGTRLEEMER